MPTDSKLTEALNFLREAVNEFDQFVDELAYFRNNQPPYPYQIRSHFRGRATSSENLKITALGILSGLESSERWYDLLNRIKVSERYPTNDDIAPSDLRPSRSALVAVGHVLENAITALSRIELLDFKPKPSHKAERGRRGPKVDFDSNRKLADIVEKFDGDWKRNAALLEDLCEKIDTGRIPKSVRWTKWEKPPRSWLHAARLKPRPVVQAIEHRLKTVQTAHLR